MPKKSLEKLKKSTKNMVFLGNTEKQRKWGENIVDLPYPNRPQHTKRNFDLFYIL